jgi:hypothetical protein
VALVAVDEALPAAPAPFDEVRDRVSVAVVEELRREAALAAARKAAERGEIAAAARTLGLEVANSNDLSPGQAPPGIGNSTPELQEALFGEGAEVGARGTIAVPAGALIYEISRREPFDAVRFESEKGALREETLQSRRDQHRQALVRQMREQQRIEINPAWLDSLDES